MANVLGSKWNTNEWKLRYFRLESECLNFGIPNINTFKCCEMKMGIILGKTELNRTEVKSCGLTKIPRNKNIMMFRVFTNAQVYTQKLSWTFFLFEHCFNYWCLFVFVMVSQLSLLNVETCIVHKYLCRVVYLIFSSSWRIFSIWHPWGSSCWNIVESGV